MARSKQGRCAHFVAGDCSNKLQSFAVYLQIYETFMVKKTLLGQVGDAEIRLLRIFKVVVDCGGLSAAELELNIGRSTVSRHIKDLEERLGLVLCHRGRAGFRLTTEGQQILAAAQTLLGAMDAFRGEVRDLHDDLVGQVCLGLFDKTATNPQAHVSDALALFRRRAPEVSLDVTVGNLSDIEAALMEGRLHMGIAPEHRRSDRLDYHFLFNETMWLYCGNHHPLFNTADKTQTWPLIQAQDYAGLAFHSPNMDATHRFKLKRRASASDQEAVAILILSGAYLGFLPEHYAADFVRRGLMRRVGPRNCSYVVRFMAMLRRSPHPSRPALALLDCLKAAHAA